MKINDNVESKVCGVIENKNIFSNSLSSVEMTTLCFQWKQKKKNSKFKLRNNVFGTFSKN